MCERSVIGRCVRGLSLSLSVCESWNSFEGKMKAALVLQLKWVILQSTCN